MSKNEDEIHLHDDAERFLRAKAQGYLNQNRRFQRRLLSDDVTATERKRIQELMEDNVKRSEYWFAFAEKYEVRF